MLTRWPAFARFLDDGRICLTTDGVEKGNRQHEGIFVGGGDLGLAGFAVQAATICS
jgi:hypothetical protein